VVLQVLHDPELSADQWKIYPCEVTPWTLIKKWFEEGTYVPYSDAELTKLLMRVLPAIPPWVRVNRVVRDIPSQVVPVRAKFFNPSSPLLFLFRFPSYASSLCLTPHLLMPIPTHAPLLHSHNSTSWLAWTAQTFARILMKR
jgi:hypothetical protein